MNKLIIITIIGILTCNLPTLAHAGSFYLNDAAGLTGPQSCDEQMHEAVWINPGNNTIKFTSALTWIGVDLKGRGDVWVFVEKLSNAEPFTFVAWDHYGDPNGLHQFVEYFTPEYEVAPGDGLRLYYFCQVKVKHMHVILKVQHK